jgi:TPP-dependent indolepyruvate ferredoxin oxidoreductase alpha subunit
MKRALINPALCTGCENCAVAAVCERKAILRETVQDKPWIDFYQCSGCMKCKTACPHNSVEALLQPCTGTRRMSW